MGAIIAAMAILGLNACADLGEGPFSAATGHGGASRTATGAYIRPVDWPAYEVWRSTQPRPFPPARLDPLSRVEDAGLPILLPLLQGADGRPAAASVTVEDDHYAAFIHGPGVSIALIGTRISRSPVRISSPPDTPAHITTGPTTARIVLERFQVTYTMTITCALARSEPMPPPSQDDAAPPDPEAGSAPSLVTPSTPCAERPWLDQLAQGLVPLDLP